MFERREPVAGRPSLQRNENKFPRTQKSKSVDFSISSNGIKFSSIQDCFRGLLSLKQVCCMCQHFEGINEAMLDSMNLPLPDKTLAERFVLVLFK